MTGLLDQFKHAVFEEEPKPESPMPVAPSNATGVAMNIGPYTAFGSISAITPVADDQAAVPIYEKLKQATRVENLTALQKVTATAKTLELVIPDPVVRLKAAMATATGLTMGNIEEDIGTLFHQLDQEHQKFESWKQGKVQELADDAQQIAALEKQLHDLRTAGVDKQTLIGRAEANFGSAFARRSAELDQIKNQFAVLK